MKREALALLGYPLDPERDAGSLRTARFLRLLADRAFRVTVGTIQRGTYAVAPGVRAAGPIGDLGAQGPESLRDHLERSGSAYALLVLSGVSVAMTCLRAVRQHAPGVPLVFDTTDLQHVRLYRRGKLTGNAGWLELALRTRRWELATAEAADVTLAISPREKMLIEQDCPRATVYLFPHVLDVGTTPPDRSAREGIVFVGSFSHHPNVDAMEYFVGDVLPLVRREIGRAPVWLVGPDPPGWLLRHAGPDLVVTGHVADIRGCLTRCRLSVAPLRYGAGVKGKVLLSMACGTPVVASTVAVEGIDVTPGRDVLVADAPADFAAAVGRLYADAELWQRCAHGGVTLVREHYSEDVAGRQLDAVLRTLSLAGEAT